MITTTNYAETISFSQKTKSLMAKDKREDTMTFEIHTLDWMQQNRWQQENTPYQHPYFEIIWVKQGRGEQWIDLETFSVDENAIYCISPGQRQLMKAPQNLKGYAISFSLDFIGMLEDHYDLVFSSGIFNTFSQSPVVRVCDEMKEEMVDIVRKMLKEFDNYYLLRAEILRGYLKIFLIYLTRQYKQVVNQVGMSNNIRIVKSFLQLLDKHYITKKMVADYAVELCITPNYMNEIVKKVTGVPASEHIKQRIILEAKRQALYTNASMKEVAYNLGFADTSHFSKFFKNACGINFTEFKQKIAHS